MPVVTAYRPQVLPPTESADGVESCGGNIEKDRQRCLIIGIVPFLSQQEWGNFLVSSATMNVLIAGCGCLMLLL